MKFKQHVERLWHSRGVVLPLEIIPSNAWQHYNDHPERMDLLLAAYGSQVTVEELKSCTPCSSGAQRATVGKGAW